MIHSTFRNTLAAFLGALAIAFTAPAAAQAEPAPKAVASYQDLWWGGPAESGWGMSITQHNDRLFAALYIYDRFGNPTWVVMPGGRWASETEYVGDIYSPTGSPYFAYDASRFDPNITIGSLSLRFTDADTAQMRITIYGETTTRTVLRQKFAAGEPVGNYTDLWWGGQAENGWGLALTQRGSQVFGVWFTYAASGQPTWFVMPGGAFDPGGTTFTGDLYVSRGPQWWGIPFNTALLVTTPVGSLSLAFRPDGTALMTTRVGDQVMAKPIFRQPF